MSNGGSKKGYEDYLDQLREHLYSLQNKYKEKKRNLTLLQMYQVYRLLGEELPEWLLSDLDSYLEIQERNERSRRRSGKDHKMSPNDYVLIVGSSDPVKAKKEYAERENIGVPAVEARMKRFKKKKADIRYFSYNIKGLFGIFNYIRQPFFML